MVKRPFGVTILAILAGIAAVLAAVRVLQFLGIIPFFFGPLEFRTVNLFSALMYALLVWVYIWVLQMLWNVKYEGWLFVVVISIFNLILYFVELVGQGAWQDVSVQMLVSAVILIYAMLPGVRRVFEASKP